MQNKFLYILLLCSLFSCKPPEIEPPKPPPDYTFLKSVIGWYWAIDSCCYMDIPLDLNFDGVATTNIANEIGNWPALRATIVARIDHFNKVKSDYWIDLGIDTPGHTMDSQGNLWSFGTFNLFLIGFEIEIDEYTHEITVTRDDTDYFNDYYHQKYGQLQSIRFGGDNNNLYLEYEQEFYTPEGWQTARCFYELEKIADGVLPPL